MNGQAALVGGHPTKTPQHTLIRVRNNQRRHRQRRREYIEFLERKLKVMEETASLLGTENEALRKQISCQLPAGRETSPSFAVGTSGTDKNTHVSSTDNGRYKETWYNNLHASSNASAITTQTSSRILPSGLIASQDRTKPNDLIGIWETPVPLLSPHKSATLFPNLMIPLSYAIEPSAPQYPSTCCSETPSETGLFSKNTGWRDDSISPPCGSSYPFESSTALCAQAFLIIQRQNRRGLPLEAIESWLWPGFIYGDDDAESGCRVDSRLLFGLLVYIGQEPDMKAHRLSSQGLL